jgi:hypothetical protein
MYRIKNHMMMNKSLEIKVLPKSYDTWDGNESAFLHNKNNNVGRRFAI